VEFGLSNAEPEGSDNEGFSQEWFNEVWGCIYSRHEAEELQLQIEPEASYKTKQKSRNVTFSNAFSSA
jgi:hypothetical protein